jgi:hypothetical protein
MSFLINPFLHAGGVVDTGRQLLLSNSLSTLATTADRYIGLGYSVSAEASITKAIIFPVAGAVKSLKFTALTQPSGAATWTATIYINGSSTSATCTVNSSTAIGDWTGNISVNAGDYATILVHPANTPAASAVAVSVGFTPITENDRIIAGGAISTAFSTSATNYATTFQGAALSTGITGANSHPLLPDGGTIDKLYIDTNDPGVGKSYAFTIMKNGTGGATSLATTISGTATAGNDTSNSVSVADGDRLHLRGVPSGTPNASNAVFGFRYVPSSVGRYPYFFSISAPGNSGTTYFHPVQGGASSGGESVVKGITHSQTFEKISARVAAAPGAAASGKKWTFTLRVNGVDTSLTCDILETATTGSATGSVTVSDNDFVSVSVTPTSSPTNSSMGVALLATR